MVDFNDLIYVQSTARPGGAAHCECGKKEKKVSEQHNLKLKTIVGECFEAFFMRREVNFLSQMDGSHRTLIICDDDKKRPITGREWDLTERESRKWMVCGVQKSSN